MSEPVKVSIKDHEYTISKMWADQSSVAYLLLQKAIPIDSLLSLFTMSEEKGMSGLITSFSKIISSIDEESFKKLYYLLLNQREEVLMEGKKIHVKDIQDILELYQLIFYVLKVNYQDFFLDAIQILVKALQGLPTTLKS